MGRAGTRWGGGRVVVVVVEIPLLILLVSEMGVGGKRVLLETHRDWAR